MTLMDLLDFFAPSLTATVPEKESALKIAENRRPWCLPESEQDEAQALYAAWLLTMKAQNAVSKVREMGIVSESEGDLSKTYGDAKETMDIGGFKSRYDELARKCPVRLRRGACVK